MSQSTLMYTIVHQGAWRSCPSICGCLLAGSPVGLKSKRFVFEILWRVNMMYELGGG